jgi:hypothetical protein
VFSCAMKGMRAALHPSTMSTQSYHVGERLLHDRRKLARRHSDELGVRFHCGGDVDEIELLTVKRFGSVGIGCACAVTLCGGSLLSRSLRIVVAPLLVLFTYLSLFNNA